MGTVTSSLVIRLQDDVSARAAKAAGALKQLGDSGKNLSRLGGSTAGLDKVAQRLDALRGKLEAVSRFKAAGRGLIDLGVDLRKARADLAEADALLKKRQDTLDHFARVKKTDPRRYATWKADGLVDQVAANFTAAKAAQAQAARAAARAQRAYDGQRATVQEMRAKVLPAGGPATKLVGTEARLRALIAQTEGEQRAQAAAQAAARARAAQSLVEPGRRSAAEIDALMPRAPAKAPASMEVPGGLSRTATAAGAAASLNPAAVPPPAADGMSRAAGTASAAAAGLGQVEAKARGAEAAVRHLAATPPPLAGFSEALTRDLAALDLTKAETRALAREVTRMRADQVKALGPIHPRYHAQILDADRGQIEDRVRTRAREMAEERRTAALLRPASQPDTKPADEATFDPAAVRGMRERMGLAARMERQRASETAAAVASDGQAFRERFTFASRMARQRAQEERRAGSEAAQAAREAARETARVEAQAARETARVAREVAREKIQAAREAAREARRLERDGAREAAQAAREAARVAREAARERIAAAREAARAAQESARQEAAALRAVARERARAAREAARQDREVARARREVGHHARTAAGFVGAGGALYGTERLARTGARTAGQSEMETARGRAVGLTPEEDRIGLDRANELSRQFPSLKPTELRELYRALHVNLGGNAQAARDTLEPVARSQVLLQNFRTPDEAQADLARIIRGAENMGISDDPKKFQVYLQGATKGMQLFGDTLRGEDYYQYAKTGRLAVAGLNPRFLGAIAPSIIDDMGGSSAGQAHYTAYNAVVAGRMKKESKAVANSFGLMGKDGRMIGRDVFQRDPLEWATKVLEPAFAKKGKGFDGNDINPFVDTLSTIFNDRNAAEFIGKLVTKQGELKRNEERFDKVRGLEGAEAVRRENPAIALEGAKTQGAQLLGEALAPAINPATVALNGLADAAASASAKLRENPEAVEGGGVVASILGAVLGPKVAGALMTKLAGDGTGVVANALRLGGAASTAVGSALGVGAGMGVPAAIGAAANEAGAVNEQGLPNLLAGRESPTARIARELGEARRQQATETGQRDELDRRIGGMRGLISRLTAHYGEAPAGRVGQDLVGHRKVLDDLEGQRDAINERLREAARGRALGQEAPIAAPVAPTAPVAATAPQAAVAATAPAAPQAASASPAPVAPQAPVAATAPQAAVAARAPVAATAPTAAQSPVDGAAIAQAAAELARYRAELAIVSERQAATAALSLPGLGRDLTAKRAEIEGLISGLEARIKALGSETIAPNIDASQVEGLGQKSGEAHDKLTSLNMTVAPQVDTSSLSAAIALARSFNAELAKIGPAIASARAQAASLTVPSAGQGGGGDGVGRQASTGMVRRGLANNFA